MNVRDVFSSPFSGTFFQKKRIHGERRTFDVFVPFLGDLFSNSDGRATVDVSDRRFRPLSRGPFFKGANSIWLIASVLVFVPFLGDLFSKKERYIMEQKNGFVFVPFLGDLFSKACLRSPSPSALASAFAAGMGDRFIRHSPSEMKCRFSQSGRASAGICNEKIEMRNEKWWCGA